MRTDTTLHPAEGGLRLSAIVRGSEDLVADWRRLTDELGGTTYPAGSWERGITELYLGGHDIGAPLALTLMRKHPKLEIRGLVVAAQRLPPQWS